MKTKQIIRTWYQNHVPTWETNNLVDDLFGREFLESLLAKRNKPKKELLHGAEKEQGENVPSRIMKLQVFSEERQRWEDVSDFNYPEHEVWTETGCYRIALNQFRLIDVTPPVGRISEDKTVEGEKCKNGCTETEMCADCIKWKMDKWAILSSKIDTEWPDEINKLVLAEKINEIINHLSSNAKTK